MKNLMAIFSLLLINSLALADRTVVPDAPTADTAISQFCSLSVNQYNTGSPYYTPNGYGSGIGYGGYSGFANGYNGYPGAGGYNYYNGYNSCSDQVQTDFCNVVMVNCGATLAQVNGPQLYSTSCKNQFQLFQNTHPNLSCSFNRYGVFGTLDNYYLQNQINLLTQMGY